MSTTQTKSKSIRTPDPQRVHISVDKSPGKRGLPLGDGDFQLSVGDKVEKQTEKTQHIFLDKMEAIAFGVQGWFEENTGYSRRVHETTVDIARQLGIPEDEIERWAAARLTRLTRDTEKLNVIKDLLQRLQESYLDGQADSKGHLRRTIRSDPA